MVQAHVDRVNQYYRRPVEGPWVPVGMPDGEETADECWRIHPVAAPQPGAWIPPASHRRSGWRRTA